MSKNQSAESTDTPEIDTDIIIEEYPDTVQVRDDRHNCVWFFRKEQFEVLDQSIPLTFTHVELDGHDFQPVKAYPWCIPDRIVEAVREDKFELIGQA